MAAAILTGLPLLITSVSCGPSDDQNVGVLNALPEMTGARRTSTESVPYYGAEGPLGRRVAGYETRALYEAAPDATAQEIIEFFVAELKDDWCYKTGENYAYENGEFVDGKSLEVIFQGHGSTILLRTHQMFSGGQAYTVAIAPTYTRDPDIDDCDR